MPLRSPKIYSFIFGFQRRVWWPKCTPASSSSFIVISTAKFPPLRIAACGSGSRYPRCATEQPSCRQLAGHDLVPVNRNGVRDVPRDVKKLTLRKLEALARALLPVLLAFLHTRVARQETICAQRR